jgi:hypothetical protein
MYFRLTFIAVLIPISAAAKDVADNSTAQLHMTTLEAKPNVCVALREGRPCFSHIEFSWLQPENEHYCLRAADTKHIIGCWDSNKRPTLLYQFESSSNALFELFNPKSGDPIATTEVQVQWVYTQRQKKRRWRLF